MLNSEAFQPIDPAVVPRFADIATFMRTRRHDIHDDIDIGLVGVPFDLGVNYRSGARQGPSAVREASRLIRRVHPTTAIKPFETTNVADIGDCPINPMNKDKSIDQIQAFFEDLKDELSDRYGPLPEEVLNLFRIVAIKKTLIPIYAKD